MIKTFFIESTLADYTAEEFSFFQKFYLEEGVLGDTGGTLGLSVTQNSPAAMNVLVSTGNGLVEIVKNATTWKVVAMSDTQATVAIPSNNSGSNRVDAIIVRVDKVTEPNALKTNIATIERVAGTGVSALSDGAIDTAVGNDGWIRLANVTVANGASSIATGVIADTRIRVKSNESIRFSPKKMEFRFTTSDPTGADLVEGLVWYNSTTHKFKYYDGTSAISMETSTYTAGYGINLNSGIISAPGIAGSMMMYGGASAPSGWLLCDGTSYLQATYAALFTAIGTTYGSADGSHFNVPDMRGRIPIGVGTGAGGGASGTGLPTGGSALTAVARAGWKGEETHQLITAELASHSHNLTGSVSTNANGAGSSAYTNSGGNTATSSTGSDTAHNNIQPVMGLNFIIKT
jgi:microcystin-dependent protein